MEPNEIDNTAPVCTMCKGEGYVYLPGFSPENDAMMRDAPNNLYERAKAVGVATAYECKFCNTVAIERERPIDESDNG